ncbi:MAG: hypothetical protein JRI68_25290 [Deltaproteobacteria bacterium]|nr:hypothetical protein [Deltaproteobacteria bacterium]
MSKRIGLVVGRQESFAEELLERLSEEPGIVAERALIGATTERHVSRYDVVVDRLSHQVPHYRQHLKALALAGGQVINDPFWWSADDPFFALSLAARLGITTLRTAMLPQNAYGPDVDNDRDLGNLECPLSWGAVGHYVKYPAVLRAADFGSRMHRVVHDLYGLWDAYNATGQRVTMLQQQVEADHWLRCICVGGDQVQVVELDGPQGRPRHHGPDDGWLAASVRDEAVAATRRLSRALGYDLNAVEWVVAGGVPRLRDGQDPVPDLGRALLGDHAFEALVGWVVELVVQRARSPRRTIDAYRWSEQLGRP